MGTGAASRSAGDTGSTRSLGSGMSSLRYLFLEANRISGVVPPSLANLHRLRELELSHNRLSGSKIGILALARDTVSIQLCVNNKYGRKRNHSPQYPHSERTARERPPKDKGKG